MSLHAKDRCLLPLKVLSESLFYTGKHSNSGPQTCRKQQDSTKQAGDLVQMTPSIMAGGTDGL